MIKKLAAVLASASVLAACGGNEISAQAPASPPSAAPAADVVVTCRPWTLQGGVKSYKEDWQTPVHPVGDVVAQATAACNSFSDVNGCDCSL